MGSEREDKELAPPLQDDRKAALEHYVQRLQTVYVRWYVRSKRRNKQLWYLSQATALLASFSAAVVAAVLTPEQLGTVPAARTALVVLPLIASLASSVLAQWRPREFMLLRDAGREGVENVIESARARYPAIAGDGPALTALHTELVQQVSAIERSQLSEFAKSSAPEAHQKS